MTVDLRSLGAFAHLFDADGDDLGFCHLPPSVGAGDLAALADGRTFRVVKAVDVGPGAAVDVLCAAEAARLVVIDSLP